VHLAPVSDLFTFLQGGFDGTSNVLASHLFGIPVKGTHSHAFVTSFGSLDDVRSSPQKIKSAIHKSVTLSAPQFLDAVLQVRNLFVSGEVKEGPAAYSFVTCVEGELAAFSSYAMAYPSGFMAVVDSYSTLGSGVANFMFVALALHELGYQPVGIRLDSGDLARLSCAARKLMTSMASAYSSLVSSRDEGVSMVEATIIMATNDLNEKRLIELELAGHAIDSFGIGTALATSSSQPALGCVFKLAELDGEPRSKKSEEISKATISCSKHVYRFYNRSTPEVKERPVLDYMCRASEPPPFAGQEISYVALRGRDDACMSIHKVTPSRVVSLLDLVWNRELGADERIVAFGTSEYLKQARERVQNELQAVVLGRKDQGEEYCTGLSLQLASEQDHF
jgi:nicotinate phosphoribosyltransferase